VTFERLVGLHVTDDAAYQAYRDAMTPLLNACGGGFRYDFKIAETLRSDTHSPINRVFAIHFPDQATSNAFFSDDAYLKIRAEYFERSVAATTILATYER